MFPALPGVFIVNPAFYPRLVMILAKFSGIVCGVSESSNIYLAYVTPGIPGILIFLI